MRNGKFWLGVAISVVFLYLGLRGLHLGEVWKAIQQADFVWLIPAVLIYFVAVAARTWRWHYMLRPMKWVSPRALFPAVVIGYMGNNVYPARAGEFIRAYVLRARETISMSASLATIIVERIFDGVVMLVFVFLSLPFTPMPGWLRQVVIFGSVIFLGALAVFFVLAATPHLAQRACEWLIARLVPARFRESIRSLAARFLEGLGFMRSARDMATIFGISLLIWLIEAVVYWFVMQCFGFREPFYVLLLMNGVVNLATTIPSSPGYVGTFDAVGIKILEGFDVPGSLAAGYTLLLHATLWLPITLVGAYFMWRESITWRDLGAAARAKAEGISDA